MVEVETSNLKQIVYFHQKLKSLDYIHWDAPFSIKLSSNYNFKMFSFKVYPQHAQAGLADSHCMQHTDKSLQFSCLSNNCWKRTGTYKFERKMLHKTYTIYTRKVTLHATHSQVLIVFVFVQQQMLEKNNMRFQKKKHRSTKDIQIQIDKPK